MRIDPILGRRLVLAAAAAGLAARLAFGLLYWVHKPLTHDEREYLALAGSLASGRGFSYEPAQDSGTTQQFGRAPAYPVFLAAIGAGGPADTVPARVKIAQSIVGAFAVWLIGLLAWRLAGPTAGAVSAWIAAIYPPLVWIAAYALSESLYCTLALSAVVLLDRAIDRADTGGRATLWAVAAGGLSGIAILVRPAMLLFLPIAGLWLMVRRRPVIAALLIVTALMIVAPWTARNYRTYGRFVLVASEGGVTFWTGNHPLARGEGDLAANPDIKRAEIDFRARHPGLTAEQLEPLYYREALDYITRHPVWWAGLLARKAFYTVVPIGPSYTLHSTLYAASSIVSYLLLAPFAIAGARAYWRGGGGDALHRSKRPEALFLLAASAAIVCVLFFPQERFRIPVIDPTLIVWAGIFAADRS
jgi:4-amino-4-deoxy-L-arabinose transferase-like glycosyltransferase